MKAIELLSPAGAYPILKAVIGAGADAVYVGGPAFGARAYADNFSKEELLESIDYAHIHNRKVYLTVNTLLKEREMEEQLFDYLLPYYEQGLDAVIVQDFGVLTFIREAFPQLSIHASTQMTVTGTDGAAFLQKQGASRIVTARELSFEEIQKIKSDTGVEIESFVHGALCYCYSGECLLSSMLGGRSGNRGRCAQPCRLPYEVLNAAGERLTREATHILSPKDLCTIGMIPQLAECGIDSFKIEGRMKQAEYAAGVTSIYRKYIDLYEQYGREAFHVDKNDEKKLESLGSRSGFTTGYYTRHNGSDMITFSKPNHTKTDEKLHETIRKTYLQKDLQRKIIFELKGEFTDCIEQETIALPEALLQISAVTGRKFFIIIDEWDALFREAQTDQRLQEEYIQLLRGLFKGIQVSRFLSGAYITGILPIKKYGTQSALTDFYEYTMLEPGPLAEFVGFTEQEVKDLCKEQQIDFEQAKKWYDGYCFGQTGHIYNPNSVMKAIFNKRFSNYCTQTETYESLRVYIDLNFDGLKDMIVDLIGEKHCRIDTGSFQNDMTSLKNKDDVLTLLVHLGYLAYDIDQKEVYIPNEEIRQEFIRAIKNGKRQELVKTNNLN